MNDESSNIEIPMSWVGIDDVPILFANQILIQQEPGEFVVTIGQLLPPPVVAATDEELRAQIADIEYVPIRPLIRMGMSPDKFKEITLAMQAACDKFDRTQAKLDPRR